MTRSIVNTAYYFQNCLGYYVGMLVVNLMPSRINNLFTYCRERPAPYEAPVLLLDE